MESSMDLYCNGLNTHYFEAFDGDNAAKLIMAMDKLEYPYTTMCYVGPGTVSLRFYVVDTDNDAVRDEWIKLHMNLSHGFDQDINFKYTYHLNVANFSLRLPYVLN